MQLAILTDSLQAGETHDTTYGPSAPIRVVEHEGHKLLVYAQEQADPRATVQALKELGATHLWLCESVGALSVLLEPGDWLIPDDYIDGTRGQHYTYFSEKAGGYVQQVPPFDPASRAALIEVLRTQTDAIYRVPTNVVGRVFQRGVYVCVSNTRLETPAEAAFWAQAGGHVVGRYLSPCLTLARELEMQVAVLAQVTRRGGESGDNLPFSYYLDVVATAGSEMGIT
jgi:5'-methylthioadenosine phosphorylase